MCGRSGQRVETTQGSGRRKDDRAKEEDAGKEQEGRAQADQLDEWPGDEVSQRTGSESSRSDDAEHAALQRREVSATASRC